MAISSLIKRGINSQKKAPKLHSYEGILMLFSSIILASTNGMLALLDYGLPGSHALLSPIVNWTAGVFIGGWIWVRGTKPPKSKALKSVMPIVLNTIPIPFIGSLIAMFPFWIWAVWTNLEK